MSTRPAREGELHVPIELRIPPNPSPPADIVALAADTFVEAILARRDHLLARERKSEAA